MIFISFLSSFLGHGDMVLVPTLCQPYGGYPLKYPFCCDWNTLSSVRNSRDRSFDTIFRIVFQRRSMSMVKWRAIYCIVILHWPEVNNVVDGSARRVKLPPWVRPSKHSGHRQRSLRQQLGQGTGQGWDRSRYMGWQKDGTMSQWGRQQVRDPATWK